MQSSLLIVVLCSLAALVFSQQMMSEDPSADKRLSRFAFAKRSPRMFAFAKRSAEEEDDSSEVEKRARFAFAKRSYRQFAFAKRASPYGFAFAKRGAYSFA